MPRPLPVVLCAVLFSPAALQGAEYHCDRSDPKVTASADGAWVVNVQEEVCDSARGAVAGITVVLASSEDAARARRVFIMPVPRSREDWPRIRWLDATSLQIRVPNLTEAAAPEPEFEGIRILLERCGDNPADRERLAAWREAVQQWQKDVSAWVKKRDQDAAAAGPRPPRPEEPRIPPGRCQD